MRSLITMRGHLAALLVLTPIVAALGYEGGRIAEYRRAIAAAEHAGAALDGALGACRARGLGNEAPAAEREVVGLTLG